MGCPDAGDNSGDTPPSEPNQISALEILSLLRGRFSGWTGLGQLREGGHLTFCLGLVQIWRTMARKSPQLSDTIHKLEAAKCLILGGALKRRIERVCGCTGLENR